MVPTLVIGLREGLEAALIVGIVAAFLGRSGRRDALVQVWIGVIAAVVLCLAIGTGLVVLSRELPERAQEGLETVVGLLAVLLVTFMIFWMNRHARGMKKELEGAASDALARGSTRALVVMAFLAVLREGFETAVFLVSLLQNSSSATAGSIGAVLGILAAAGIGYGIYRGGVHLNLARFFTATGMVLVLVAAGLLATAAHTAHEAGWLNLGQAAAFNLSWLVHPGGVVEALLTGVLGLRARPAVVEVIVYLAYAIPMLVFIGRPRRRRPAPASQTSRTDHAGPRVEQPATGA